MMQHCEVRCIVPTDDKFRWDRSNWMRCAHHILQNDCERTCRCGLQAQTAESLLKRVTNFMNHHVASWEEEDVLVMIQDVLAVWKAENGLSV